MDNLYGNSSAQVPNRTILSPINNLISSPNPYYHHARPVSPNPYYHQTHPMLDPYASPDGDTTVLETMDSSLVRYLQSRSTLLASPDGDHSPSDGYRYKRSSRTNSGGSTRLEPPRLSRSPLEFKSASPGKIEEEVLVMDGILVKTPPVARVKSSSSMGSGKTSSSSSGKKNYKKEISRSDRENSGVYNQGLKCQFAHGKEELSPVLFPQISKLETATCKQYGSGNCSYGSKCRFLHHETCPAASASPSVATSTTQTVSPVKLDKPTSSILDISSTDWSPQDDGIEIHISSGKSPSREAVDAYINKVLYGTRRTKRLPVFENICPE